ncbi:MAG: precorrin-6y C5,15-methyltransferase (decarboxylating) subunit CbiE [Coriobacteriales bacterium]|nr:precorrin-6y C5,15-methyltransferase (decarboxylating) subunit CbiE [Coriobacteriales bacterium]
MESRTQARQVVYVVGMGMGDTGTLTMAACEALRSSELVVGSARLLESLAAHTALGARQVALVAPSQIAQEIRSSGAAVASVVMSGDVGLHSGAMRLYEHLDGMEVHVLPGVSSVQYLCARLRVPWQDVHVVSAHGRDADVVGAVQTHEKTFVLTGGSVHAGDVCAQLVERGLGDVRVAVGERLSYADERVMQGTASALAGQTFDGLAVMLVANERPLQPSVAAPSLPDSAFVRGEVPMTKEEVRALSVCKLRVAPSHVVWDVGAGTGSVSVELARAACAGQVVAIEKDERACELVRANAEAFGVTNVRIVRGVAPEALQSLPAPDRVFVGGSTGRLAAILAAVVAANPSVRVCVSAIVLETLMEALDCVRELGLTHVDLTQVAVAKGKDVAGRHMMLARNPVYLVCADGPAAIGEGRPCA